MSEAYDVVVVGGGGAGLAAAITSAELGRRTLLLEKAPKLGGSTGWSIGSITAACTEEQRRAGIADSVDDHLADMSLFVGKLANRDNPSLLRVFAENAAASIEWLKSLGIVFAGPFLEPPHRRPRMLVTLPNSRSLIHHLERRARAVGVEIRLSTAARKLIGGGEGVDGVETDTGSIMARAVILAGGDFSASREYKVEFGAPALADLPPINTYATGDCQRMAREVGGVILNGDLLGEPRPRFPPVSSEPWWLKLPPSPLLTKPMAMALHHLPSALIRPFVMRFVTAAMAPEMELFDEGALLLNRDGEIIPVGRGPGGGGLLTGPGYAVAREPEGIAYALLDARLVKRFSNWPHFVSTAPGLAYAYIDDYRRSRPDLVSEAADLGTIATMRSMSSEVLKRSAASREGFGPGPFLILGPMKPFTILTQGGLKISPRLEVLTGEGRPISRLYAVGSAGQGGMLLRGHGHHLGWAFTSGRLAGGIVSAALGY